MRDNLGQSDRDCQVSCGSANWQMSTMGGKRTFLLQHSRSLMVELVSKMGSQPPRRPNRDGRLRVTEEWYRNFVVSNPAAAEGELVDMLLQHEAQLRQLEGRVLDVGGGSGTVARFLSPSVEYWVVDPSTVWQEPAIAAVASRIRANGPTPRFVEGVGEDLPFADGHFDAAIAFWSLNHADDPYRCVNEIARVLRPGGCAYLVLEDMMPTWRELIGHAAERVAARFGREHRATVGTPPLITAFPAKALGRWPLSPDHVLIDESLFLATARRSMAMVDRRWIAGYLTFTFRRAEQSPGSKS